MSQVDGLFDGKQNKGSPAALLHVLQSPPCYGLFCSRSRLHLVPVTHAGPGAMRTVKDAQWTIQHSSISLAWPNYKPDGLEIILNRLADLPSMQVSR